METVIVGNIFLYAIVFLVYYIYLFHKRINAKNWKTWVLTLYGFISGSVVVFLLDPKRLSLEVGLIFSLGTLFTIFITSRQRNYSEKKADEWVDRHEKSDKNPTVALLSRMVSDIHNKKNTTD